MDPTFTRRSNLKGHLRPHFEEKPYNLIDPDVGKGLLDDMIVNDTNNCAVISNRLSVGGQFMRMHVLNRHLKNEMDVECARLWREVVVCWEIWIVGWRQIGGGGADILFGGSGL